MNPLVFLTVPTMKKILITLALLTSSLAAQAQVGVSVGISQPGFYGRIDLGGRPPPAVIYQQPVLIQAPVYVAAPQPVYVQRAPIYLRVPPGHSKHWAKHCYRYNACGQPVYFVRDYKSHGHHGHH